MVDVNPGVATGTLLEVDAATIIGQANFLDHFARALVTTRVEENMPLALSTDISPNPVSAGETPDDRITVDNISGETPFGVTLQLRYPKHLNGLSTSYISDNVSCTYNYCEPNKFATWSLGTMTPGASITVDLPPVVNASTAKGTLISSHATVKEDNGRRVESNQTLLVSDQGFYEPPVQNIATPDLAGLTQATADDAIINAGLTAGAVNTANSDNVDSREGYQPESSSGANIPVGSAVNLVISTGSGTLQLQTSLLSVYIKIFLAV